MSNILVRTSLCGGHNLLLLIGTGSTIQPVIIMGLLIVVSCCTSTTCQIMVLLKDPKVTQFSILPIKQIIDFLYVLVLSVVTIESINIYTILCSCFSYIFFVLKILTAIILQKEQIWNIFRRIKLWLRFHIITWDTVLYIVPIFVIRAKKYK